MKRHILISSLRLFLPRLWGGGGALASNDKEIIFASSDGRFFSYDGVNFVDGRLPTINMGRDEFKIQQTYSFIEKPPRIHCIALDKDYAYISFDKYNFESKQIQFVIAKISIYRSDNHWEVLYSSPAIDASYYAMGAGGRLVVSGDTIIATVGDYSLDRKNNLPSDFAPQNEKLPFGKIIEISKNKTSEFKIRSFGLRNAQGLALVNGTIFASEHGPRGGDRLLKITNKDNYGWPITGFGTSYTSYESPPKPEKSKLCGYADAKFLMRAFYYVLHFFADCQFYAEGFHVFVPSIAPTSLIQTNDFFDRWKGDILLGSLKAQTLYRINIRGDRVLYIEPIFIGQRIRDLIEWKHSLYLLLDNGNFMKIDKTGNNFVGLNTRNILAECGACHNIDPHSQQKEKTGPDLVGVFGRKIGATDYNYSASLHSKRSQTWSRDNLGKFLQDTSSFAPGTSMPPLALTITPKDIDAIIDSLEKLKSVR